MHSRCRALCLVPIPAAIACSAVAHAQDLGHRTPGIVGLYGGAQQPLGLYVVDRFSDFSANRLYSPSGTITPTVGLKENTFLYTLGVTFTLDVKWISAHATAAVAAFNGRSTLNAASPSLHADDSGIGDLWIMPVQLGWRLPHVDFVVDYAFYVPTGGFTYSRPPGAPISGLGTGHWTNEISVGSAVYFDRRRTWSLSALATYGINTRDTSVDIKDGNIVDLDVSAGKRFWGLLDFGVISFLHWQVSDDHGVPASEQGVRNNLASIGPEADLTMHKLRTVFTLRYLYDVHAQARTAGQSFVGVLTFTLWAPHRTTPGSPVPASLGN